MELTGGKIVFCATPEGMLRQLQSLSRDGVTPRLLRSGEDVLEAMLDLEFGRNVVAYAPAASTGWVLPDGVEIVCDADLRGGDLTRLWAHCREMGGEYLYPETRPEAEILPLPTRSEPLNLEAFRGRVQNPFAPAQPDLALPEAS